MEIAFFKQHMMVMGDFFLNGYKEEYPNCKFPAFNSLKGRWKGAFMNNIFLMRYDNATERSGPWVFPIVKVATTLRKFSQSTLERPGVLLPDYLVREIKGHGKPYS